MLGDRHLASGDLCLESAPLSQGSRASLLVETIWPMTVGSNAVACSQPITSRHSNALFMKSSVCPSSANARSVAAASRASASMEGSLPVCYRRGEGALGGLTVAHACPPPQPALENGRLQLAVKRRTLPPRRLAIAVCRHPSRPRLAGEIRRRPRENGRNSVRRRATAR